MKDEDYKMLKRLEREVEKIDRDVDSVIVEGFSDMKAVKELGFTGRIYMSAERTVEDLAEDVVRGSETVAILTDFDSHGKKQNRILAQALQEDIRIDFSARKSFGKELTSQDRYAVEDVIPLFSSWRDKFTEATLHRLFPGE